MAARFEIQEAVFKTPGGGSVVVQINAGVSVAVKDLSGNNLTVYSGETGAGTHSNPLTTDAAGRIEGWVEAPDFDLEVAADTPYTQNVRLSAPGVFHVHSYGAKGDDSTNDRAAIAAADAAASAAGGGDVVYAADRIYRIGSAIPVSTGVNHLGQGSTTIVRCTGNHFAFAIGGHRLRIERLHIDAVSTQSSGGGFDYTGSGSNVTVAYCMMGSNLHTGFSLTPSAARNSFFIDHIRWNGITGSNTAILIGDGTNLITDAHISHLIGTASTAADMAGQWVKLRNNVDTIHLTDALFIQGAVGIVIGEVAAGISTNHKFTNVIVDSMTGYGWRFIEAQRFDWLACAAQSCGSSTEAGVHIQGGTFAVTLTGGIIQNCVGNGVSIQAGSTETTLNGVLVANNNTGNNASQDGISVAANTTDFAILNCTSGNNLFAATAGHQKYGLRVANGTSDRFRVLGNHWRSNETGGMLNGATGAIQTIRSNIGGSTPTVASAATVTLPGDDVVKISGTTSITSITAGEPNRQVTLIFTGTAATTGLVNGSNLKIGANFVYTPDDAITLVCDGTNWYRPSAGAVN